jgi:ATP-dependent exoDNAse (exonuclease V) beta subunit
MPWLSRLGGVPQVSDQPQRLYRQAVQQVVHLHHEQPALNQAVEQLLHHLDNRADILEELLMQLLARRDQWLRHLFSDEVSQRQSLEEALAHIVNSRLQPLAARIDSDSMKELLALGRFAAEHCAKQPRPLCELRHVDQSPMPVAEDLPIWQAMADLLLTADGGWRKRLDKNCGFPAGKQEPFASMKQRMKALLETLQLQDSDLWASVRQLPSPVYSERQWQTLQALMGVLPQTVAQLWLIFSRSGQVDFAEIALKARQALVDSGNPTEQLLMLDHQVRHILIDEFQDTSWLQFDLLTTLTAGWQPGEGRSLFVVGDPMQSIYRFREAEVGLFLQAGKSGVGGFPLEPLQLRANFRSQQGVVDWVNRWFPTIFPATEAAGVGAVSYAQAQPVLPLAGGAAVEVFAQLRQEPEVEAQRVCTLVGSVLQQSQDETVAILVRSRPHLTAILTALRQAKIHYQAQDVDVLASRPAVLDLVALTRAMLHPADHLSWLTVLRAPWSGLLLTDLSLFQCQSSQTVLEMMRDSELLQGLTLDGRQRVARVEQVMTHGVARRGCCGLRELIEEAWQGLSGPDCYSDDACRDVERALQLLEKLDYGGDLRSFEQFEDELGSLFAAGDQLADGRVQVMTIHKSKGLEFDHVILPGLGRRPRAEQKSLLRWQEHSEVGLLLAPIAARASGDNDPIYDLLGQIEQQKGEHEVARLLYVAVTRAKRKLYLLGHAELNKDEEPQPAKGSLLEKLWPAVETDYLVVEEAPGEEQEVESVSKIQRLAVVGKPLPERQTDCDQNARVNWSNGDEQLAALVGTITHRWLEFFAGRDLAELQNDFLARMPQAVAAELAQQGVAPDQSSSLAKHVVAMVTNTLEGERGRWILHAHHLARCEYELSGVVDGELVHAIVDRTFVENGTRWIIDYKTAKLKKEQSKPAFYAQQLERYRSQLQSYQYLLQRLDPQHVCRCALYFPAFDGWCELADELDPQSRLFD